MPAVSRSFLMSALHAVVEVAPRFLRSPGFDTFFIESPQVGIPRSVLLEHDLQSSAYEPGLNISEFQEVFFTNHQCFTSYLHIQHDARSVGLSVISNKLDREVEYSVVRNMSS